MPNLQSLVLTDRQATPVNHTFLPVSEKDGLATVALADATGAVITEKRFTIQQKRTPGRVRTTVRLSVPTVVTETINGVSSPQVIRSALVDCSFVFADTSTMAERNDIVGMFASALATGKVLVNDTIVKGEAIW